MNFDFIVEGKAFVNNSFQECNIGIEDGTITSIKKILTGAQKKKYPKKLILPAGIDIHVHFRDPGYPQKETFQSGSTAAAFGGISCVFDMPNTKPQTTTIQQVKEKIRNAESTSLVDFGIYAGVSDTNINDIQTLTSQVHGFKLFMGSTTNSLLFLKKNFKTLFTNLQGCSKPLLIHAEEESCLKQHASKENTLLDHHKNRPPLCEVKALQSICEHAPFPSPVHICHVSSNEALQFLLSLNQEISIGITPHHSLLDIYDTGGNPTYFKVNPPLRSEEHRQTLFNALCSGEASILESDHAPHSIHDKDKDFDLAPSGIPGVESMYPLFLYLAWKQEISFERIIDLLCKKPAQLMKIPKGFLEKGYDADLIVIDPKNHEKISAEKLHSKAQFTPFQQFPAIFPDHVYLRGKHIIEHKELYAKPGIGTQVKK